MAHKPLPILSNMPWHIKQKIVGFTDPVTQMNLQTCSKDLRNVVDKAPVVYDRLNINLKTDKIEIVMHPFSKPSECFDQNLTVCFQKRNQKVVIEKTGLISSNIEKDGDYLDQAMKYLGKIFYKNPKSLVTVHRLMIDLTCASRLSIDFLAFEARKTEFLRNFQHLARGEFSVRHIFLHIEINEQHIVSVLQNLRPRVLKCISITGNYNDVYRECLLSEVTALEQWKQARILVCTGFLCTMPLDTWKHFETVPFMQFAIMDLEIVKYIIRKLGKSPTWRRGQFFADVFPQDVLDYFRQFPKVPAENEVREIIIPNCDTQVIHVTMYPDVLVLRKQPYVPR